MKLCFILFLTAVFGLAAVASEITRGTTLTDGQQLYASDLHNLIDTATVGVGFYNDQQTVAALGTGYYFLILDPATQTYRRITASTAFYGNTNFWLYNVVSSSAPIWGSVLYYDPTNNYLRTISISNLVSGAASSVNVSNLVFGTTNGYKLPNWTGSYSGFQTNNQPQLLTWGTNGQPYQQSLSNLEIAVAADLGTNRSLPFIYNQMFQPWNVYGTNTYGFTNAWGFQNVFPITNLFITNSYPSSTNTPTLTNADTIPIYSTKQGSNTTVSLLALGQFIYPAPAITYTTNNGIFTIGGSGSGVTNRWTNSFGQKFFGYVRCSVNDNSGAVSVIVSNATTGFIEAQFDAVSSGPTGTRTNVLTFLAQTNDVYQIFTNNPSASKIITNFWKGL